MRARLLSLAGCVLAALVVVPARSAPVVRAEPVLAYRLTNDAAVLHVELEGDDRSRQCVLRAAQVRNEGHVLEVEVDLPARARKALSLRVPAGGVAPAVELELLEDDQVHFETRIEQPPLPNQVRLTAVIGPVPPTLRGSDREGHEVVRLDPDRLPTNPLAWPRMSRLIWGAPRSLDLSPAHGRALLAWVRAGGHLVVGRAEDEPDPWGAAGLTDLLDETGRGLGTVERHDVDLTRTNVLASRLLPAVDAETTHHSPGNFWGPLEARLGEGLSRPRPSRAGAWIILILFMIWLAVLALRSRRPGARRGLPRLLLSTLLPTFVATLAMLVVGPGRAPRFDGHARLDLIDLDRSGHPWRATSLLVTQSSRSREKTLRSNDEKLSLLTAHQLHSAWVPMDLARSVVLTGRADDSGSLSGLTVTPRRWDVVVARFGWVPDPSLGDTVAEASLFAPDGDTDWFQVISNLSAAQHEWQRWPTSSSEHRYLDGAVGPEIGDITPEVSLTVFRSPLGATTTESELE
ncbi:MAG: hypothetical protein AAF533_04880 [Acidobacteriota bacterium]